MKKMRGVHDHETTADQVKLQVQGALWGMAGRLSAGRGSCTLLGTRTERMTCAFPQVTANKGAQLVRSKTRSSLCRSPLFKTKCETSQAEDASERAPAPAPAPAGSPAPALAPMPAHEETQDTEPSFEWDIYSQTFSSSADLAPALAQSLVDDEQGACEAVADDARPASSYADMEAPGGWRCDAAMVPSLPGPTGACALQLREIRTSEV